jgi:hypothetical protein
MSGSGVIVAIEAVKLIISYNFGIEECNNIMQIKSATSFHHTKHCKETMREREVSTYLSVSTFFLLPVRRLCQTMGELKNM